MKNGRDKDSGQSSGRSVVYATKTSSMSPIDRRKARTLRSLFAALEQLAGTLPLDELSVGALTDAADINRVTFYSHFRSLDEIVNQAVQAGLRDASGAMEAPFVDASATAQAAANIRAYALALSRHRALFVWVEASSHRNRLHELVFEGMIELLKSRTASISGEAAANSIRKDGNTAARGRKTELFFIYTAAGLARLVVELVLGQKTKSDLAELEDLLPDIWLPKAYEALGIAAR